MALGAEHFRKDSVDVFASDFVTICALSDLYQLACGTCKRGGYLDIHHFRPFQWRPAQRAADITPLRRVYDLRHTFATFALRAGISTFDLSRLTMIDRHYGHLARDGREHAIKLLDALNAPWTLVDAAWTSEEKDSVTADNNSPEIAG